MRTLLPVPPGVRDQASNPPVASIRGLKREAGILALQESGVVALLAMARFTSVSLTADTVSQPMVSLGSTLSSVSRALPVDPSGWWASLESTRATLRTLPFGISGMN